MRTIRLSLFLLAFAAMAHADHYADFYVIPVASHTPGQNGTMWMSDVAIQNFQPAPLTVELLLVRSGENDPDNITPIAVGSSLGSTIVPANGSVLLRDVLNNHNVAAAISGAILIGADRPFAVTSRSYSQSPSGDTVGQTVPAVRDFLDNTVGRTDLATAVAYVPGLMQNARYRTNLGMVIGNASGSGSTMGVSVTLRGADGGSLGTKLVSVPPGQIVHVQFPATAVTDRPFDIGGAEFRITQGSGAVVPYASVIDNNTAGAMFVTGQFPPNSAATATSFFPSTLRLMFDRATAR